MKLNFLTSASGLTLCGVLLAASAVWGGRAYATTINGSDSLVAGTAIVHGGVGDLLSATSIDIGSQGWGIAPGGATGDFGNLVAAGSIFGLPYGSTITGSTLTLLNLGAYNFTSNDGSFAAASSLVVNGNTYTSEVVAASGSLAGGSESLAIYIVGTFTPAGTLSAFSAGNASETISFNETGIVNSGAGGYGSFAVVSTFASPAAAPPTLPPTNSPEPASMALIGTGLLGLGAIRLRRRGYSLLPRRGGNTSPIAA